MKSHMKNVLIYYIGYVTIKDLKFIKNNILNPLYLIISKVTGYFEEINKSKYLMLVLLIKAKKKFKKMKNCGLKSET